MHAEQGGTERDAAWLSDAIGRPVASPEQIYAEQSAIPLRAVEKELGIAVPDPIG